MKGTIRKTIRHGLEDSSAYCRECSFRSFGLGAGHQPAKKAREHCDKTKHTVDVYRENHTEYTYYQKK